MKIKFNIQDPDVKQYIDMLSQLSKADPRNTQQYLAQAMGVYSSYMDSQKPESKLAKVYGEDAAPKLLASGLDPNAITDTQYTDTLNPLIQQYLTLKSKQQTGKADTTDTTRMTALQGLINNPSKIAEYQYYKPTQEEVDAAIESDPWKKWLRDNGLGLFAQPSTLQLKNTKFRDIIGNVGNINPLQ